MICSAWQATHDPDSEEEPEQDLRYRYDGKFMPNAKVVGTWQTVALVDSIRDFNPKTKATLGENPIKNIELRENGSTGTTSFLWSGDILMDLDRSQALKITPETLDGSDYLFIEAGGLDPKNPIGWKSQWMVLKRK